MALLVVPAPTNPIMNTTKQTLLADIAFFTNETIRNANAVKDMVGKKNMQNKTLKSVLTNTSNPNKFPKPINSND